MTGQNYFDKANQLHFEGKLNEAIEYYKASIRVEPSVEAHSFLAWAYSQLGKNMDAIEELKKAIALNSDFGPAYNDIGTNFYNLGKYDEAIEYFKLAIAKMEQENLYIPYFNMGQVFEKQYKWFDALGCYTQANKIKPDYDLSKTAAVRVNSFLN
jgi:tetratricopeptide (TPR) repeat protein